MRIFFYPGIGISVGISIISACLPWTAVFARISLDTGCVCVAYKEEQIQEERTDEAK